MTKIAYVVPLSGTNPNSHHLSNEAVGNPLSDFYSLLRQFQSYKVALVKADEMKLCSQSAGTFPSRMIAMVRLRIMLAPVSSATLTISTSTPDGLAALPNFNLEMTFFTISMVIGIGERES